MALATRIEPLGKDLSILVDDTLSPRAQSKAVATFARGELKEAQTINSRALGRVPRHKWWVDGRTGAPFDSVKAESGIIRIEFEILIDVLIFIAQTLFAKSPVRSGDYRASHLLFADGVQVTSGAQLAVLAREYVFLNPLLYARKIEAGKMKMRVPGSDHVYEQTRQIAARRFGNMALIRFSWRSPILSYVPVGRGGPKTGPKPGKAQRSAANIERASRVPALIVTLR